jgi:5-(carboxyamino)imidazole ribonucleotide synthase
MKIGVIGGGQLAQMLALAAYPLGLKVVCLEPGADCPAASVTHVIQGDYNDLANLKLLAEQADVITYEFENIPIEALEFLEDRGSIIYPPLSALSISQDRFKEKSFFDKLNIPTTCYFLADSETSLQRAIARIELPAIVKTQRFGYDGKGQYVIHAAKDVASAWESLQKQSLLVENLVDFEREVSCIGVRSISGDILFY